MRWDCFRFFATLLSSIIIVVTVVATFDSYTTSLTTGVERLNIVRLFTLIITLAVAFMMLSDVSGFKVRF